MNKKGGLKRILITPGEPSGIGPDIVIKALKTFNAPFYIVADPELISERSDQLNIKVDKKIYAEHFITVDSKSLRYVLDCLDVATDLCMKKKAAALLTGPVNKAMINRLGIKFTGHTEYLAQKTKSKVVVMFFESPTLKLALVTDHIPLAKVSEHITSARLQHVFTLVNDSLKKYYKIKKPAIAVCGLNPHAGENGFMGSEDLEIIAPVIRAYQRKGINVSGPHSADSLFYSKSLSQYDAVISMYHDQGLSVLKHRHFGQAVNITLGLPFLRTSVDHGTACELAGTGKASAKNMIYAFSRTVELL